MSYDYGWKVLVYDAEMNRLVVEGDIRDNLTLCSGARGISGGLHYIYIDYWYGWEEDMCSLSMTFPTLYFAVERVDEDSDFERAFFSRGILLSRIYGEIVYKYDFTVAEGGTAQDVIRVNKINEKFNPYG